MISQFRSSSYHSTGCFEVENGIRAIQGLSPLTTKEYRHVHSNSEKESPREPVNKLKHHAKKS